MPCFHHKTIMFFKWHVPEPKQYSMMSFNLLCVLSLLLLPCLATAQNNGTVRVGQYITAADNSQPWFSPSRDFAFGFHKLDNEDLFLPAIWYYKIPSKTIVWYASADNPAPRGSRLQLTADRGLVLDGPDGQELWKSGITMSAAAFGFLYDTGNFVVADANSEKLWQSFDDPVDTLLPSQIMERGGVVSSKRSETDFSQGRFQFRLLQDGNAVLNTINLPSGFAYDAYFWSNTFDQNRSNAGLQVVFNESGYLYVVRENNQRVFLTPGTIVSSKENYHRATLNFDGSFVLYTHPRNTNGNNGIWSVIRTMPDNICVNNDIRKGLGSGICGHNSICTLNSLRRPNCTCPKGFSLVDPDDPYGNCKPDFIQGCEEDEGKSEEDLYHIEELKSTDWPTSDFEQLTPSSREDCESSCLKDCLCSASVFRLDTCWKKKLPLSYGKMDPADNGTAFIKIRKGEGNGKKKRDIFVLVGSVLLGSSVFINLILVAASCLGLLIVNQKKLTRTHPPEGVSHMNLRCFTYKELVEATRGFKEELGRGAFGTVYKGFMDIAPNNLVAVKKLDRVFHDSEKEFKAEVNVIGQTHHKNLVRLLGFCDEGENRLIVYEFLSNGTLASFLFGDYKPNWELRTNIAMEIAKGLLYLHEECCTQIIHCDIKPQNILLDDNYNARISDFGLAKLLTLNQSHTSTVIRGTKGYVAPEWFRNTPVTVKVDVYSFGVLLLEIICLRRCVEKEASTIDKAILTDWAYDCYKERQFGTLVEDDPDVMDDMNKLQRFVMVAIWCIQEDPSLRPTMSKVIEMLEGVVEVPFPPCPWPFNITS
ncbi:G-type lectin S-receptor-like serine/threonine-protein kinase RLK1 [Mangifera indica]|uniref:G-type lectin S-receptor-like serine/threonine-protein kinase RLK1 n=1 Tax=Mangifera indica TaxID=29780 RepID=UPI001CFBE359|nr:G-type lectin S-receptor-like serine/threonine-protein kinase RLK1 [Mangifera indica]